MSFDEAMHDAAGCAWVPSGRSSVPSSGPFPGPHEGAGSGLGGVAGPSSQHGAVVVANGERGRCRENDRSGSVAALPRGYRGGDGLRNPPGGGHGGRSPDYRSPLAADSQYGSLCVRSPRVEPGGLVASRLRPSGDALSTKSSCDFRSINQLGELSSGNTCGKVPSSPEQPGASQAFTERCAVVASSMTCSSNAQCSGDGEPNSGPPNFPVKVGRPRSLADSEMRLSAVRARIRCRLAAVSVPSQLGVGEEPP